MSAPPNTFNSNTNFNKFKGCYFNSDVDCSGGNLIIRNGNLYLAPNSSIYTTGNSITFDETYFFTNFNQNVHIFGITQVNNGLQMIGGNITCAPNSSILTSGNSINFDDVYNYINIPNNFHVSGSFVQDYGGVQYDVGQLISQIGTMTYYGPSDFNLFKNTFCEGQIQFQDSVGAHIDSVPYLRKLNLGDYADKTISNTYTTQQNFSSLRLDGSLLLNAGVLSISNATLQKLQFCSTISSDIQTQTTVNTNKLTQITYTSGTLTTAIANNTTCSVLRLDSNLLLNAGALSISNATLQKLQFCSTISSDIQTQTTALQTKTTQITYTAGTTTTTFGGSTIVMPYTQFTSSLRLDGALLLNTGLLNIPKTTLESIQYLSGVSSNIATSISTITTKTTDISYATSTTTIANTTSCNNITFSGQFNGVFKANYDTAISRILTLVSPAQTQIDGKVSLTGAETIAGIKTFSDPPVLSGASITAGTIPLTALANSGFVDLTTSQSILTGTKSWTAQQTFLGNIRIDGSLLLNGSLTTLSNADLQKISLINSLSSNCQTQLNNLSSNVVDINQKLTNIAYTSASNTTFVSNILNSSTLTFSTSINSIPPATFAFINSLSSNCQNQLNNLSSNVTDINQKLTNIAYTSASNTTFVNSILSTYTLSFSNSLNGISSTVYGYLSGCSANIQTSLNNLSTRLTTVEEIKIGSVIHCLIVGESTSWKYCNGQALSRTTYSVLFGLIGITYGSGDGSTTFNLPNFDGLFIRNNGGQTYGGISYASTSPGVIQQDSFQDHQHLGQSGGYLGTNNTTQPLSSNAYTTGISKPATYSFSNTGFQVNGRSSTETRPINVSLILLIKVL